MKTSLILSGVLLAGILAIHAPVYAQETNTNADNSEATPGVMETTSVTDDSGDDFFPTVEIENATKPTDATAQVQFLVGQSVEVNTAAVNDIYTMSNSAIFNNTVDGDIFAAGNTIVINAKATIDGSVHAAGNSVLLDSTVKRNVLIMGNTVHIGHNAVLMGNVSIFAKEVTIDGTIYGSAHIEASTVNGNGDILADSNINADTIVLGNLSDESLIHTTASEHKRNSSLANRYRGNMMWWIGKFFFSAAFGIVLLLLFPRSFENGARVLDRRPFLVAWRGLIVLCVVPVASVLACFTLVGIPFAIITMIGYAIMIMIAHMWTGYWIGHKLLKDMHVRNARFNTVLLFIVGLFIISAAAQAPFIGMLVTIAALLCGIGALTSRTE